MRLGNVTGNENAPLPAFASPLPSITEPFQSTSTCRSKVGIGPLFSLAHARSLVANSATFRCIQKIGKDDLRLRTVQYRNIKGPGSGLSCRDAELHGDADQSQHDPCDRHPWLSGTGRHRIQDPHVPAARRARRRSVAEDSKRTAYEQPCASILRLFDDYIAQLTHR